MSSSLQEPGWRSSHYVKWAGQCDTEKREGDKAHAGLKLLPGSDPCDRAHFLTFYFAEVSHTALPEFKWQKRCAPPTGRGADDWQSQSSNEPLATCIFIFLGEFFRRINSYWAPLLSPWPTENQMPIAKPHATSSGLDQTGVILEPHGEGWTQDKNQGSGRRRANVVFPGVVFWMQARAERPLPFLCN